MGRRAGILCKKIGMTQAFNEHGRVVAVTVVEAGPCTVTQVKTPEKDGYQAVQIGFQPVVAKHVTKPLQGHQKKAGGMFRYLREVAVDGDKVYEVGQQVTADSIFKEGELVDVTGTSIGKGFQGGVKRYHWKGGPRTHGSMSHRAPGSIGSTTTPGRVYKGHHLPGHMGDDTVTVQNLRIMKIDAERHQMVIQGAIPGPENRLVLVRRSTKRPGVVVAAKAIQETFEEEEEKKGKKPAAKKK